MADLLAATSLLATIIAVLYSVWYPEIESSREIKPERKRADRDPQIRQVEATLRTRAIPLMTAGCLLCVVLAPELLRVLGATVRAVESGLSGSWPPYDTLAAAFVVSYAFLVSLASLAAAQVLGLWQQMSTLRRRDPD